MIINLSMDLFIYLHPAHTKKNSNKPRKQPGKKAGIFIQKNSRAYRIRYLKPLFRKKPRV